MFARHGFGFLDFVLVLEERKRNDGFLHSEYRSTSDSGKILVGHRTSHELTKRFIYIDVTRLISIVSKPING